MTLNTELSESARPQLDGFVLQDMEMEIHERLGTLAEAIRNKKIDRVMAHYAPDVVVYDLQPPLEVRGSIAYRKNFEKWFASMAGRINYEMSDVHVSACETHATTHCISHVTGARSGGGRADYWVRVTSGWRKVHGEWLVAHEHISMPTMM
jgi:ketosteroid isomerase-like protein